MHVRHYWPLHSPIMYAVIYKWGNGPSLIILANCCVRGVRDMQAPLCPRRLLFSPILISSNHVQSQRIISRHLYDELRCWSRDCWLPNDRSHSLHSNTECDAPDPTRVPLERAPRRSSLCVPEPDHLVVRGRRDQLAVRRDIRLPRFVTDIEQHRDCRTKSFVTI
jgi:hypothetical protein